MPQVAARKARVDRRTARENGFRLEVDYGVEVEPWWNEDGDLTKPLRKEIFLVAAALEKLAAVPVKLNLRKPETDSLNEALKVSRKEFAAINSVVEVQRARLDATRAKLSKLKSHRDVGSASIATYRGKLLLGREKFVMSLPKSKG